MKKPSEMSSTSFMYILKVLLFIWAVFLLELFNSDFLPDYI